MARLLCVVLLVACSSSSAPRTDPLITATAIDARPGEALAPGCPASFAAAGGTCSHDGVCSYDEGACSCSVGPWCGGMAPPEDRPQTWQCTPKVRADGCPGAQPSAGAACEPEGKTCDYTCSCLLTATCTQHQWAFTHGACMP